RISACWQSRRNHEVPNRIGNTKKYQSVAYPRTEKHSKPGSYFKLRPGLWPTDPYRTIFPERHIEAENNKDVHRYCINPACLLGNDVLRIFKACLCLLIKNN